MSSDKDGKSVGSSRSRLVQKTEKEKNKTRASLPVAGPSRSDSASVEEVPSRIVIPPSPPDLPPESPEHSGDDGSEGEEASERDSVPANSGAVPTGDEGDTTQADGESDEEFDADDALKDFRDNQLPGAMDELLALAREKGAKRIKDRLHELLWAKVTAEIDARSMRDTVARAERQNGSLQKALETEKKRVSRITAANSKTIDSLSARLRAVARESDSKSWEVSSDVEDRPLELPGPGARAVVNDIRDKGLKSVVAELIRWAHGKEPTCAVDEACAMYVAVRSKKFQDIVRSNVGTMLTSMFRSSIPRTAPGNRAASDSCSAIVNLVVYELVDALGLSHMLAVDVRRRSALIKTHIQRGSEGEDPLGDDLAKAAARHIVAVDERVADNPDVLKQLLLRAGDVETNPGPRFIGPIKIQVAPKLPEPTTLREERIVNGLHQAMNEDPDFFRVGSGQRIFKHGRASHHLFTDDELRSHIEPRGIQPLDHVEFIPEAPAIHRRMAADRAVTMRDVVANTGEEGRQAMKDMFLQGEILQDPTKHGIWEDIKNIGRGIAARLGSVARAAAPEVYDAASKFIEGKGTIGDVASGVRGLVGAISNPGATAERALNEAVNIASKDLSSLGSFIHSKIFPNNVFRRDNNDNLALSGDVESNPGPVMLGSPGVDDQDCFTVSEIMRGKLPGPSRDDENYAGDVLGPDVPHGSFDNLSGGVGSDPNSLMMLQGFSGNGLGAGAQYSEPPPEITNIPQSYIATADGAITPVANPVACNPTQTFFQAQLHEMSGIPLVPSAFGQSFVQAELQYNMSTQSVASGTTTDGFLHRDIATLMKGKFPNGADQSTLLFKLMLARQAFRVAEAQITTCIFGWTGMPMNTNLAAGRGMPEYTAMGPPMARTAQIIDPYNQYIADTGAAAPTSICFYSNLDAIPVARANYPLLALPSCWTPYLKYLLLAWAPWPVLQLYDLVSHTNVIGGAGNALPTYRVETKWKIPGHNILNVLVGGTYAQGAAAGVGAVPAPNLLSGPFATPGMAANFNLLVNINQTGAAGYSLLALAMTFWGNNLQGFDGLAVDTFLTTQWMIRTKMGADAAYCKLLAQMSGVAYAPAQLASPAAGDTVGPNLWCRDSGKVPESGAATRTTPGPFCYNSGFNSTNTPLISPHGITMWGCGYGSKGGILHLPMPNATAFSQIMVGGAIPQKADPVYTEDPRYNGFTKLINSRIVQAGVNVLLYGMSLTSYEHEGDVYQDTLLPNYSKHLQARAYNSTQMRWNYAVLLESIVEYIAQTRVPVNAVRRGVFDGVDWVNSRFAYNPSFSNGYNNFVPQTMTVTAMASVCSKMPFDYFPGSRMEKMPYSTEELRTIARPKAHDPAYQVVSMPLESNWYSTSTPSSRKNIRSMWIASMTTSTTARRLGYNRTPVAANWWDHVKHVSYPNSTQTNGATGAISAIDWMGYVGVPSPMACFNQWSMSGQGPPTILFSTNATPGQLASNNLSGLGINNSWYWITTKLSTFVLPQVTPTADLTQIYDPMSFIEANIKRGSGSKQEEVGKSLDEMRDAAVKGGEDPLGGVISRPSTG